MIIHHTNTMKHKFPSILDSKASSPAFFNGSICKKKKNKPKRKEQE
jgi:hypothetical protein